MAHPVLVPFKLHTSCSQSPVLQVTFAFSAGSVQSTPVQPGLQEHSCCPTGWCISSRLQRTSAVSQRPPCIQQRLLCLSWRTCHSPLNASSLFSTTTTQPLTVTGKGEPILRVLFSVILPYSLLEKKKQITKNLWSTDHCSYTVFPCPSAWCQRSWISPKKMQKPKIIQELADSLASTLQVQGYFTHSSSLFQRCLYFTESRLIISKIISWQLGISIIHFSLDIKPLKYIAGFENYTQSVSP